MNYAKAVCVFTAAFVLPLIASAHATPVHMEPASSAALTETPREVVVRFSERLEPGASRMSVRGPQGETVSEEARVGPEPRTLSASVRDDGEGAYFVSWSVVSADDGHFTRGSFAFSVGEGIVVGSAFQQVEVVHIAQTPEVVAMTIELFGNGVLWAALLLFALAVRPLRRKEARASEWPRIARGYTGFVLFGALAALLGGALQLVWKTRELSALHDTALFDAFFMYTATAAGSAGLWRMGAIVFFLGVFALARKKILASERFTVYETLLVLALAIFAFFRAIVSHATANPFFPELSVAINFFHLIEKDAWAGIALIVALLSFSARTREVLQALLPKASALLALLLGGLSVTGAYIVWLHLKSFGNIFLTEWGSAFLALLSASLLLVVLRAYHTFAPHSSPRFFSSALPATLFAEFGAALLVVYFSSAIIITSPPFDAPRNIIAAAKSEGATILLERSRDEDDSLLLVFEGGMLSNTPVVYAEQSGERILLEPAIRFEDGYALTRPLTEGSRLEIIAPQEGRYDARAVFNVPPLPDDEEGRRAFDLFAQALVAVALVGIAVSAVLYRFANYSTPSLLHPPRARRALVGIAAVALFGAGVAWAASNAALSNPYKALCEGDGNMWHLMLPTRAGIPTSMTPREGCMALGGAYHFADKRAYEYARAPGASEVSLAYAPERPTAGEETKLHLRVRRADGSPAELFVEHEKYIHVIVISADMNFFAHVHPDDERPLTEEEIRSASFTVPFVFPKAGDYIVAVDYAHRLSHESQAFSVRVDGAPSQAIGPARYPSPGQFGAYEVSLAYGAPIAGEVSNLYYTVTRDGAPVENIEPYLGAAMHLAIVRDDLSAIIHTHGEVHDPDVPPPPILVRDGKILHSIESHYLPPRFGPSVEAHVIFPSPGIYTVWGEMKIEGEVIPTAFTIRVE